MFRHCLTELQDLYAAQPFLHALIAAVLVIMSGGVFAIASLQRTARPACADHRSAGAHNGLMSLHCFTELQELYAVQPFFKLWAGRSSGGHVNDMRGVPA